MLIKTRFAPSPTGLLHLGNIRTALFSLLFARKNRGKFVLRIEDTDVFRSSKIYTKNIISTLKWLKINWDEGPIFQSERIQHYKNVIQDMLQKNKAYKCYCSKDLLESKKQKQILKKETPKYDRTCRNIKTVIKNDRPYTIRFANPIEGSVVFYDEIRGKIEVKNSELSDIVIQRTDGMPTYNFCVVIDDRDSNITHVIRGEDHLSNTPKQINILKAINASIPKYAHLSMIVNENGKKLSKRDNELNLQNLYNQGILPEAILNYVVRLGWSNGNKEIFSLSEMKNLFSLKNVNKSSSIFKIEKLLWMNKYYINNLPTNYLKQNLKLFLERLSIYKHNSIDLKKIINLLKPRCSTIKKMAELSIYFYKEIKKNTSSHLEKYKNLKSIKILEEIKKNINLIKVWNVTNINKILLSISLKKNYSLKEIYSLVRTVITGTQSSPSITSICFILGKEQLILRISNTILRLKKILT